MGAAGAAAPQFQDPTQALLARACREPLTPDVVGALKAHMVTTPAADVDAAFAAVLDSLLDRTLLFLLWW
jgi:hypothetical protein